jgi:hypothetical protein
VTVPTLLFAPEIEDAAAALIEPLPDHRVTPRQLLGLMPQLGTAAMATSLLRAMEQSARGIVMKLPPSTPGGRRRLTFRLNCGDPSTWWVKLPRRRRAAATRS